MGLDATVYCDCFERGTLREPPAPGWEVHVDASGARSARASALDALLAFDQWDLRACVHERGRVTSHFLGNSATIDFLRQTLLRSGLHVPVLLGQVVRNGTHCGDQVAVRDLEALAIEVAAIGRLHLSPAAEDAILRRFVEAMSDLVATALSVRKPIAF